MTEGRVKSYDAVKGSGVIETAEGSEVYVRSSNIQTDGLKSLEEGQRVQFDITEGTTGPQAMHVIPL